MGKWQTHSRHHKREIEVSPFPAGDHKAHINRRAQRHSKHKTEQKHKRSTKEVPPWNGQWNILLEGLNRFNSANLTLYLDVDQDTQTPGPHEKVSKGAKIRNRYKKVPHLIQDIKGKWQTHSRHHKREPRGQPPPSRRPQSTHKWFMWDVWIVHTTMWPKVSVSLVKKASFVYTGKSSCK